MISDGKASWKPAFGVNQLAFGAAMVGGSPLPAGRSATGASRRSAQAVRRKQGRGSAPVSVEISPTQVEALLLLGKVDWDEGLLK